MECESLMSSHIKLTRLDYVVALISCMIFLSFWLVIATFPNFYFVNPSAQIDPVRRFELVLSTLGWIFISTISPLSLMIYSFGYHKAVKFLPLTGLLWPISLVISQVTSYVQTGYFYLEYLSNFPIFIYTDLVLPVLIMFIWLDIKPRKQKINLENQPMVNA